MTDIAIYDTNGRRQTTTGAEPGSAVGPSESVASRWFSQGLLFAARGSRLVVQLETKAHSRARLDRHYAWGQSDTLSRFLEQTRRVITQDCEFTQIEDRRDSVQPVLETVSSTTPNRVVDPQYWEEFQALSEDEETTQLEFIVPDRSTAVAMAKFGYMRGITDSILVRKSDASSSNSGSGSGSRSSPGVPPVELLLTVNRDAEEAHPTESTVTAHKKLRERREEAALKEATQTVREQVSRLQAETSLEDREIRTHLADALPAKSGPLGDRGAGVTSGHPSEKEQPSGAGPAPLVMKSLAVGGSVLFVAVGLWLVLGLGLGLGVRVDMTGLAAMAQQRFGSVLQSLNRNGLAALTSLGGSDLAMGVITIVFIGGLIGVFAALLVWPVYQRRSRD